MRVIAVANEKGGVGKTTTAVNLGAIAARGGRRVLIVDLDPQGHATQGIEEAHVPGLAITAGTMESPDDVRRHIGRLSPQPDLVLIDCPPHLGVLTDAALGAATGVLVPMQAQYPSYVGFDRLRAAIAGVQRRHNPGLEVDGILFTQVDRRVRIQTEFMETLRAELPANGYRVFRTAIPQSSKAQEAAQGSIPLVEYAPRSPAAVAYAALAAEMGLVPPSAAEHG